MDDFTLYKYLKERTEGMNDEQFVNKFRKFMRRHSKNDFDRDTRSRHTDYDTEKFISKFRHNYNDTDDNDIYEMMKYMRDSMGSSHFNESSAKEIVSDMYHMSNGRKHTGEKFDMSKAREVCERYRGVFPSSVTAADVYVAINAQYHDYAELFKSWFGDDIEQKIIESAIIFWFKDDDYKDGYKLTEYFGEY